MANGSAQNYLAVTIDYETWHPVPEGKRVDWNHDVLKPTEKLLALASQVGVKITLMAEMGEYFWLRTNRPEMAAQMENQWVQAIQSGHDVQLHLHPCWLPELGASFQDGEWYWDWSKSKAHDYPGDLTELIGRCKRVLECLLRSVDPHYQVSCFRAGAYQAQPFRRLYDALVANQIYCDSSVYAGGVSRERGYDYSFAYSAHQPYFANAYDPQLKAPPAERGIVELPVFTYSPDQRWFLDGSEGAHFAGHLMKFMEDRNPLFQDARSNPKIQRLREMLCTAYFRLRPVHRWLNQIFPKPLAHFMTSYSPETLALQQYFILIGHSKSDLRFDDIQANLERLKNDGRFKFITLSEMASLAREELLAGLHRQSALEEATYQVQKERRAILGDARNEAQSYYLQELIPWDRETVLDLGCGAGYWSDRISKSYPWMHVTGVDCGAEFVAKARAMYGSERVLFKVEDFGHLSFGDNSFDCVYADNSLEHAFDVEGTLHEIYRVLQRGGVLVAAIPSDGRNPRKICENHTWKTVPHEVLLRLEKAGFVNIEIRELDIFRALGMPPYPPSQDNMMYVRAWKTEGEGASKLDRALEAMSWVYRKLCPEQSSEGNNPVEIIRKGYAFCWGYAVVLGKLLQQEGYPVKWLTMLAKDHPKGRGKERIDSHEVVLVDLNGRQVILDPMANTCIPCSVEDIFRRPELAVPKKNPDQRYIEREYCLYDTAAWYGRVFKYALRTDVSQRILFWKRVHHPRTLPQTERS